MDEEQDLNPRQILMTFYAAIGFSRCTGLSLRQAWTNLYDNPPDEKTFLILQELDKAGQFNG